MTDVYQTTRNKEKTQAELATSIKALVDNDIDMLICEVWQILSLKNSLRTRKLSQIPSRQLFPP